jgi:hypothetical protein
MREDSAATGRFHSDAIVAGDDSTHGTPGGQIARPVQPHGLGLLGLAGVGCGDGRRGVS